MAAQTPSPAARPRRRRETVENYIKRLEALEDVALGFKGVDKAYALQAGREVRGDGQAGSGGRGRRRRLNSTSSSASRTPWTIRGRSRSRDPGAAGR